MSSASWPLSQLSFPLPNTGPPNTQPQAEEHCVQKGKEDHVVVSNRTSQARMPSDYYSDAVWAWVRHLHSAHANILALGRLGQEDCLEFQASMGFVENSNQLEL